MVKRIATSALAVAVLMMPVKLSLAQNETPVKTFTGIENAREIINNIRFNDIDAMPLNYWAKNAIYESAALEAVKGYGDQNFVPSKTLSKEEAIALIYRMIGKEDAAQKAAEALDARRGINQKKDQALSMWADGYLKLAADDGLITNSDLQTALQRFQPKSGTKNKFVRADPAQRQEVAYWAAKAMKLDPVYGQQNIFNSYSDWSASDPEKVPYIEAVLQKKIMNGKSGARFDPLGSIRRDEMAQVLSNMGEQVFPLRKMEKKKGYVESVYQDTVQNLNDGKTSRTFDIRGEDGKLYRITAEIPLNQASQRKQEFEPGQNLYNEKELIVYRNGKIGDSSVIQQNDSLEYIVDSDDRVKFIEAVPGTTEQETLSAIISAVDAINETVSLRDQNGNITTYKLRNNAEILNDGNKIPLSEVQTDRLASLILENNQVIRIETKLPSPGEEQQDITGIVEDNSPSLNYISLYDEQGSSSKSKLRVFEYNPYNIEVLRNGKAAEIKDIQPGDTVHIVFDDDGNVKLISGIDNYELAYGKIISKSKNSIAVEFNDGSQQVLDIDDDIVVISEKKVSTYDSLKDGDYIRMLLQKTPNATKVREISTQTYSQDISNVYKAVLSDVDGLYGKITLKHPEKLYKGDWERDNKVGFLVLDIDKDIRIYDGNKRLDIDTAKGLYKGKEVYVAAKRSYGNQELAVMLSFRNPEQRELVYDDSISSVSDSELIILEKATRPIEYNEGTIVVKDGRLVSGRSLSGSDDVYAAVNRDIDELNLQAGVIMTVEKPKLDLVQIFRGKIKDIDTTKEFTLSTFSVLNGMVWEYNGFPKTFDIGFKTRIIGDEGIISTRDFSPYDDADYIGKSVYVIADETEAILVSTAPYGAFNVTGEVVSVTAETSSDSNDSGDEEETTTLKLVNASVYKKDSGAWDKKGNVEMGILTNTVVIKNGEIVDIDDIEEGDLVRVLMKDDTAQGDAYLILVEK